MTRMQMTRTMTHQQQQANQQQQQQAASAAASTASRQQAASTSNQLFQFTGDSKIEIVTGSRPSLKNLDLQFVKCFPRWKIDSNNLQTVWGIQ